MDNSFQQWAKTKLAKHGYAATNLGNWIEVNGTAIMSYTAVNGLINLGRDSHGEE